MADAVGLWVIVYSCVTSVKTMDTHIIIIIHVHLKPEYFSYLVPRTYPMTSGGRRGAITDLLTTSRHPFRSFDTLRDSAARRQVQSLILSSHRFLWPPLLLPPLTVPCMIVFERPEDLSSMISLQRPLELSAFSISLYV